MANLKVGSTFKHKEHTLTVVRRQGNTIMVYCLEYGYEVFRLTDTGSIPHEEERTHFWLEMNAERCFDNMVTWHEPVVD